MRREEIKDIKADDVDFSFREGEYLLTLTQDGVQYKGEGEEFTRPYSDVKVYRVIARKRVSDVGRERLYLTAPIPVPRGYNRFAFKDGEETNRTHEFYGEEKEALEKAIKKFSIPVIDRRKGAGVAKPPLKTFSEDGGITHRIVAIASFVFVAFVIAAVIMYLIHHFMQTDTELLTIVFAIFCLPCIAVVVIKSQELGSKVKIYEKGVQVKIRRKCVYRGTNAPFAVEKAYFTWDEVESVERVQSQVQYQVRFRLGHSVIAVPDFDGLYDFISERFPEVCKAEN